MTWRERIILALLAAINFTHILDFMVMAPLGNFLMPYFNLNAQQFSVLLASYSIAACVSGFIAAFFVDRFDRKGVLLFGYTGFILATIGCGIAPNFPFLLTSRILAGLFGGLIGAQVMSIVADTFSYERRGAAMGILFSAFSLASVIGVPIGLYLATVISWHAPFLAIGGMGILIIFLVMKYLRPMKGHLKNRDLSLHWFAVINNIFIRKEQLTALALSACLMLGHFIIIPFLNPYMEYNVGFTDMQRNLVYIVGGIGTMLFSPLIGRIADKYGKHRVFTVSALLSLIPIVLITNMPAIAYYYVLAVTGIWFVFSTGRGIPANAIISNVVPPQQRGSFMSVNSSVQQLFIGLASLIAGWVVKAPPGQKLSNYNVTGYISIAIVLLCVFIAQKLHVRSEAWAAEELAP